MTANLDLILSNVAAIEQAYDDCIQNNWMHLIEKLQEKMTGKSKESQLSICYGIATGDYGSLKVVALALIAILIGLRTPA